jgi:hypothetical protein
MDRRIYRICRIYGAYRIYNMHNVLKDTLHKHQHCVRIAAALESHFVAKAYTAVRKLRQGRESVRHHGEEDG